MNATVPSTRTWSRPPLIKSTRLRYSLILAAAAYLTVALGTLDVNWGRVAQGVEKGGKFVIAFLHPDFTARWDEILIGMQESLAMTVTATVLGVVLSLPVALGAARNLAPGYVYYPCRALIAVSRSLHEVVLAVLFVVAVGFGPFAGFLTITVATIGFLGKLLAEDIEDIDESQLEAIRATGASWTQTIDYGVEPQVIPRLIGLALYRLDINFRESAVIGLVGAGGVGATLKTAIDRYEWDVAAAIILIIIAIVMVAEYTSGMLRKRVQ